MDYHFKTEDEVITALDNLQKEIEKAVSPYVNGITNRQNLLKLCDVAADKRNDMRKIVTAAARAGLLEGQSFGKISEKIDVLLYESFKIKINIGGVSATEGRAYTSEITHHNFNQDNPVIETTEVFEEGSSGKAGCIGKLLFVGFDGDEREDLSAFSSIVHEKYDPIDPERWYKTEIDKVNSTLRSILKDNSNKEGKIKYCSKETGLALDNAIVALNNASKQDQPFLKQAVLDAHKNAKESEDKFLKSYKEDKSINPNQGKVHDFVVLSIKEAKVDCNNIDKHIMGISENLSEKTHGKIYVKAESEFFNALRLAVNSPSAETIEAYDDARKSYANVLGISDFGDDYTKVENMLAKNNSPTAKVTNAIKGVVRFTTSVKTLPPEYAVRATEVSRKLGEMDSGNTVRQLRTLVDNADKSPVAAEALRLYKNDRVEDQLRLADKSSNRNNNSNNRV